MTEQHNDEYYIRDTNDGKVNLSILPFTEEPGEPLQIVAVIGRQQPVPPKTEMSRKEFSNWRSELEQQGHTVLLRFAS